MELNASRKRSVILHKRRTSISLEDSFWNSLHAIVRMENITISDFVEKVSRQRRTPNLSSSLRVAVLEYYQHLAASGINGRGDASLTIPPRNDASRDGDQSQDLEQIVDFWKGLKPCRVLLATPDLAPDTLTPVHENADSA
jgi:predicted DNA-binding ribbon-helix-helix protein